MSEIQAVAPEFLSVQVEDEVIRVRAYDSGVRNFASFAVFVPVTRNGDKLQFAVNPEKLRFRDIADKDKGSSYSFAIPRKDWPDTEPVLLLLGYLQTFGIGGTNRPRTRARSRKKSQPSSNERLRRLRAVEEALDADGINELRSGLITGYPRSSRQGDPREIRFAFASCQFPSDFLDYMPTDVYAVPGPADSSLLHLSDLLGTPDAPTLLLLAGDQVYIDSTAGLFDPKVKDDLFRIPYERRGRSRGVMAVMQRLDLRVETTLDDHEISDNWEPGDDAELLARGKKSYFTFQRPFEHLRDDTWRYFDHDGIPFFLGDTRTEREGRRAGYTRTYHDGRTALNWREAKIMGAKQFDELCKWITAPENARLPKFVLTPAAILPRHLNVARDPACALHSDGWDGYPHSQHKLLQFICDNEVKGLVFLSGDDHICNFTEATISCKGTNKTSVLYSIHSSGLYAPYPFANAKPHDFASPEKFKFPDPVKGPYCCEVKTSFADERDGFTLVTARRERGGWDLDVKFHSADGPKAKCYQPNTVGLL